MRGTPAFATVLSLVLAHGALASPWGRPVEESPDGPEHTRVYLTEEEALQEVFGAGTDSIEAREWTPTSEERAALERSLGWRVAEPSFHIFEGFAAGVLRARAMITEQVGLYRPITFIVKVGLDGKVEDVRVMVYRESRGDEVRRVRFLKQYRGKDLSSPIRINRDIIAVTGATYSTRAINAGVRRVLHIVEMYVQRFARRSEAAGARRGAHGAGGTL